MIWGSTSEFILAMIRAGWPASACAHLALDQRRTAGSARCAGATISLFQSFALRVAGQQVEERAGVFAELAAGR